MSTSLPVKQQRTLHSASTLSTWGHGLRRLSVVLLSILATVLALIFALPVVLLFFATAVPLPVSIALTAIDIGIVIALFRLERTPLSIGTAVVGIIFVSAVAVWLSQVFAKTPPILDAAGNPVSNSVAIMEQVKLGGDDQWVTIRGQNINNPVLLFLAGGPGGSELAWTRQYLSALEDHFVVVNWDQPGAGKSYNAVDIKTLTPERYITDAYELTQLMRARFHQDKIYVLGESWGTILGAWLVQQHPSLFHAYIASAQMVYTTLDDQMGYEFALQYLTEQGNSATVEQLRRTGSPPYSGPGNFWTYAAYLNVLNSYMYRHANGEGGGDNRLLDVIAAPEYGLIDKVNWVRGLDEVFTNLYPQLGEIDMISNVPKLGVPTYFIEGRWDVNAMASLVERYYDVLEAPHKELIWFENSGHTPLYEEPRRFVDVMVNTVLAQTLPPPPDINSFFGYFNTKIPNYLREYKIAGAVVAVVQDGRPVHLQGYGSANLVQRIPMDAEGSVVHIGSAGKTFTAIAAMQLVEQGLLELDADVTDYIDFDIPATFPQPITIRHLLTHTSGLEAHDMGIILLDSKTLPTTRDFLIRNLPDRARSPGEAIGYSNYGLTLLGYVVERVSGMPLGDYLEKSVIEPLGMTHTSAQILPPGTLNLAVGYEALQPQPTEYIAAFGAAPVRSTAADMANYMIANLQLGHFRDGQILQPETAQSMQTQQFSADPRLNGIGFGFYEMSRNEQRILGHLGTTNYFHSLMLLLPEHQLGIFVSFNSAEGAQVLRTETFMRDLMDNFFPQTYSAVAPPVDFVRRADDYSGIYFWNNLHGQNTIEKFPFLMDAVTIRPTDDNRLRVSTNGTGRTFTETEPDTFLRSDGQDLLVFHRDDNGQVTGASLNSRAVFTLERRSWYESPSITIAALIGTGLVFVAGLVINGIHLWLTRGNNASVVANVGQWSALLIPLMNLTFIVGLALLLPTLFHNFPGVTLRLVLLLPMMTTALTLALAGITLMDWVQRSDTLFMRLQYSVLVIAGVVFAVVLYIWNLLGWRI